MLPISGKYVMVHCEINTLQRALMRKTVLDCFMLVSYI